MIEMELNKIVIDEKRHDQLIVLKEKGGARVLPIVIGLSEVLAIRSKISGSTTPRPLTHDLLFEDISSLNAKVDKILIDKLEDDVFYAKLVLVSESGRISFIDARPSDSIAVAVRAKAPIFVDESVIAQTDKFDGSK